MTIEEFKKRFKDNWGNDLKGALTPVTIKIGEIGDWAWLVGLTFRNEEWTLYSPDFTKTGRDCCPFIYEKRIITEKEAKLYLEDIK